MRLDKLFKRGLIVTNMAATPTGDDGPSPNVLQVVQMKEGRKGVIQIDYPDVTTLPFELKILVVLLPKLWAVVNFNTFYPPGGEIVKLSVGRQISRPDLQTFFWKRFK